MTLFEKKSTGVTLGCVALPFGVIVLLFVGAIGASISLRFLTYESKIPCTFIRADNVISGESSHYRVFCKEETLDIEDDAITGNFRSSDLFGQVSATEPGSTIYFDGYGVRVGFLSAKRTVFRLSGK